MHVHSSVGASKKSMFYFSLYFVFFFALVMCGCGIFTKQTQANRENFSQFQLLSAQEGSAMVIGTRRPYQNLQIQFFLHIYFKCFILNQEIFINGCFNARTINLNELYFKRKNFGLTLVRETYALLTQQSQAYLLSITYVLVILSHRDAETESNVHA